MNLGALEERIREIIREEIAALRLASEYIDQNHSPLGKRRHCQLVREGKLRGYREGRLVLVKRADLDEYLLRNRQRTVRKTPTLVVDDIDRTLEANGFVRRAG